MKNNNGLPLEENVTLLLESPVDFFTDKNYSTDNFIEYYMIKEGEIGWIGYTTTPVTNGVVQLYSPLGVGNMTGTGEYPVEELIKITKEEYTNISIPQMAWILDDKDIEQQEYELQLMKVMKKYNLSI